jgi:hypothetical protein
MGVEIFVFVVFETVHLLLDFCPLGRFMLVVKDLSLERVGLVLVKTNDHLLEILE